MASRRTRSNKAADAPPDPDGTADKPEEPNPWLKEGADAPDAADIADPSAALNPSARRGRPALRRARRRQTAAGVRAPRRGSNSLRAKSRKPAWSGPTWCRYTWSYPASMYAWIFSRWTSGSGPQVMASAI